MTSFKAKVESSSLGSRDGQAARRSVSTQRAASVVGRSIKSGAIVPKNITKKPGGK